MSKIINGFAIILMAMFLLAFSSQKSSKYTGGSPAGYTNSPYDNKTCTQCHVQHVGVPHFKENMITSNIPANGYVAGETYTLNLSIATSHTNKFGFICSPHDNSGNMLGELIVTDAINTKLVGQQTKYATHTSAGSNGSNYMQTWTFDWQAPTGVNSVTFYAAITAGNANNDSTFTTTFTVNGDVSNIEESNYNKQFSLYPNPADKYLFINGKITPGTFYSIYNTSGQKLIEIQAQNETEKIDISLLSNGLYFFVIDKESFVETHKFIKQ